MPVFFEIIDLGGNSMSNKQSLTLLYATERLIFLKDHVQGDPKLCLPFPGQK